MAWTSQTPMSNPVDLIAVANEDQDQGCRHRLRVIELASSHPDSADGPKPGRHGRGPDDRLAEGGRKDDQRDSFHGVSDDGKQDAEHRNHKGEMPEPHPVTSPEPCSHRLIHLYVPFFGSADNPHSLGSSPDAKIAVNETLVLEGLEKNQEQRLTPAHYPQVGFRRVLNESLMLQSRAGYGSESKVGETR
jgi:hypothetical protein